MHSDAPDLRRRDACRLGLRLLALGALAGVAGLLGARRAAVETPDDGAAGPACGTPAACAGCPLRQRCGSAAAPPAPGPTPGGGPRR